MAETRKNPFQTITYEGNAARKLGTAAPELEREERQEQRRVSQEQLERARGAKRNAAVALREQQKVSLVAIAGFAMVILLAVSVLASYIQLNGIYAQTVRAQSSLTQLEADYAKLEAEDQEIFDNETLNKAAAAANLVKPGISQQMYVELSDPDNAVVYQQNDQISGAEKAWRTVRSLVSGVGEYFN